MVTRFSKLRSSSTALLQNLRRSLRDQAHRITTPSEPRIDDTYLVEFPKSGITWLTFLLASVNLQKSGIQRAPTFYAINDLIPDIHTSRHLGPALSFPGHRMIKSHASYNPLYSKVIYLVRDPRDVMASYYAFMSKLGWYQDTLSAMLRDPHFGIEAWCNHAQGWLTQTRPSVSFTVLRYEDLRSDTFNCLKKLYRLLGYEIEESILKNAIEISSFIKMKENEYFCSENNLTLPKDFTFVRKGGSSHKNELTADDIIYINEKAKNIMKIFNYSS